MVNQAAVLPCKLLEIEACQGLTKWLKHSSMHSNETLKNEMCNFLKYVSIYVKVTGGIMKADRTKKGKFISKLKLHIFSR